MALCAAAILGGAAPATAAQLYPRDGLRILLVPFDAAASLDGAQQQIALGAQLPEPSIDLFLRTMWRGGDVTVGLESTTGAVGLGERFADAGISVLLDDATDDPILDRALLAFQRRRIDGGPTVLVVATDDLESWHRGSPDDTVIFGIDEDLPTLFVAEGPAGLLDPDRSGLPGIVSPYDLTRFLAARMGIEVDATMPGAPLTLHEDPDPMGTVLGLRARFLADRAWRAPVSQTSVAVIIIACIIGLIAAMRRGSLRIARSAGGVIMGAFIGSLAAALLPLGGLPLRIVVLAICCIVGAVIPTARTYTLISLKILAALTILTVIAAARGSGEPALSLWPSPLDASRASGLLNGYCVLIVGALLTLTALGWGSRWSRGLLAAAAIGVIGAPQLGANYGGVVFAVIAIAATAAIQRSGKLRVRDLVIVGALGIVVLIGALALDIGGQTHGGRLLDTFRADGIGVIVDVLRGRWETSAVVTGRFGVIAWVGFWLMLPILAIVLVGVIAPRKVDLLARISMRTRAVVGGLVLAAFAALLIEDTGFLTAGTLLGFIVALILFDVAPPPPAYATVPATVPEGAPA